MENEFHHLFWLETTSSYHINDPPNCMQLFGDPARIIQVIPGSCYSPFLHQLLNLVEFSVKGLKAFRVVDVHRTLFRSFMPWPNIDRVLTANTPSISHTAPKHPKKTHTSKNPSHHLSFLTKQRLANLSSFTMAQGDVLRHRQTNARLRSHSSKGSVNEAGLTSTTVTQHQDTRTVLDQILHALLGWAKMIWNSWNGED